MRFPPARTAPSPFEGRLLGLKGLARGFFAGAAQRAFLLVFALAALAGCASAPEPSGTGFPEIERWWK